MNRCPVCQTIKGVDSQDYCLVCAWEFEYFFDELSEEEKKKYNERLQNYKSIYLKSINNEEIKILQKKLQRKEVLFNELEKQYNELKNQTKEKISIPQNDATISLLSDEKNKINIKKIRYFIWNTISVLFQILILLFAFIALITFTFIVLKAYVSSLGEYESYIDIIIVSESFLFLWIAIRELKKLLIKKGLVKSNEKSPIFYFIGSWIGFIGYIIMEVLNYLINKVRK